MAGPLPKLSSVRRYLGKRVGDSAISMPAWFRGEAVLMSVRESEREYVCMTGSLPIVDDEGRDFFYNSRLVSQMLS